MACTFVTLVDQTTQWAEAEPGSAEEGADEVPAVIDGRFRIDETLGRGGMGVVHLAWDQRLDRPVALKVVKALGAAQSQLLRDRLDREARALAKLSHPNVVPVFEVGEFEGELYVAMEYVPGRTLGQWLEEEPRPWRAVVEMFIQAARGLQAAHRAGMLHRDFKPDNAIIGEDGRVRVLDFGLVRTLEEGPELGDGAAKSDGALSSTLTDVGATVGTPAYMAAEQFLGEPVDERTDVFALCVSLYEGLFGVRPYVGKTRFALFKAVKDGRAQLPADRRGVPGWLCKCVMKGLARDKAARHPSVTAVIDALEQGLARRRRRVLAAGLGVGVSLAGVVGWSVSHAAQVSGQEPCEALVGQVDRVWTGDRQAALVPEDGDAGGTASALEYTSARIDALAESWRSSARGLCDGDVAPAPQVPARQCLESWLPSLERAIELVVQRDAQTLSHAPDLLARITPPEGDFCQVGRDPVVDPQVWTLSERARESAIAGDTERARELAGQAMERAEGLDERELSPHLAEAFAAAGEVLARAGDFEGAHEKFVEAERHAIAAESSRRLLEMRLLWAKVDARREAPDRGADHLRRAEALGHALEQAESPTHVAELEEAMGIVARAQGDHERAIGHHRRAFELFTELERPLLAARALLGVGASEQLLSRFDEAREAYTQAANVYESIGVPEPYRNRVTAEMNLAAVALSVSDTAGLRSFDYVARNGSAEQRLLALAGGTNLAVDLEDREQARRWADLVVRELERQPDASLATTHAAQLAAGLALAGLLELRSGESMIRAAVKTADSLPVSARLETLRYWVEWLEHRDRCFDVRTTLEKFDALVALDAEAASAYESWRETHPTARCAG